MKWNEKLQAVINYVENHLQRKEELIDSEEISKNCRMFFWLFSKSIFIHEWYQFLGVCSLTKINVSRI